MKSNKNQPLLLAIQPVGPSLLILFHIYYQNIFLSKEKKPQIYNYIEKLSSYCGLRQSLQYGRMAMKIANSF